jgi:hypothetical protein
MSLDAMPLDLPSAELQIVKAALVNLGWCEGLRIDFEATNRTSVDWSFVRVNTILLTETGDVFEGKVVTVEQTFAAGKKGKFSCELDLYSAKDFGPNLERGQIIVEMVAFHSGLADMGAVPIPGEAFVRAEFPANTLESMFKVINANVFKTPPQDGNDTSVMVRLMAQPLTAHELHEVTIRGAALDKAGKVIEQFSVSSEFKPGHRWVGANHIYAKEKKLSGATFKLELLASLPVASGVAQRKGLDRA